MKIEGGCKNKMTGEEWIRLIESKRKEIHQAINMMVEEIPGTEWKAYEILLYDNGKVVLQRYASIDIHDEQWLNNKAVSFLRIEHNNYINALLFVRLQADGIIDSTINFIRKFGKIK